MNALARSHARYDPHDHLGDYSDFDYRQGYYYAKPSDLMKDLEIGGDVGACHWANEYKGGEEE